MDFLHSLFQGFLSSIGPFFLLLGLLIFVHELGHYLVAVWCGVRVETFSLGFGKKIFQYKRGHTTYCISIIPLGGYVKMFGDDPTNPPPPEERSQSFLHQPVWPRIAIVLAGPIMNLLFAILLFAHIGFWGEPVPGTQVGDIEKTSAAYSYGFRSGDKITHVNDKSVTTWKEVRKVINANASKLVSFDIVRESGETTKVKARPGLMENPNIFASQRKVGRLQGLRLDSRSSLVAVSDPNKSYGIKNLEIITAINGEKIEYWRHLEERLNTAFLAAKPFTLELQSTDPKVEEDQKRTITIDPLKVPMAGSAMARLGLQSPELNIEAVKPFSPAEESGLLRGDRILAINGETLNEWQDLLERIKSYDESEGSLEFTILRNGKEQILNIAPEVTEIPNMKGNFDKRFAIGISPAIYSSPNNTEINKAGGVLASLWYGTVQSWEWTRLIGVSFVRLIDGEVSAKNIGGVISIGRVASRSYDMGWLAFIKMMAIISINLFILNLLPVPVLDGGHLVFFGIEAIKGSPLSLKKMEIAQQVGLVLLLTLMVFALFNDVNNLLTSW